MPALARGLGLDAMFVGSRALASIFSNIRRYRAQTMPVPEHFALSSLHQTILFNFPVGSRSAAFCSEHIKEVNETMICCNSDETNHVEQYICYS